MRMHGVWNGAERVVPVLHIIHFNVRFAFRRQKSGNGERVTRGGITRWFLFEVMPHGSVVQHGLVAFQR